MYPRSPVFSEWVKDEAQRVVYDAARRGAVSGILERQNRGWGASAKTLANVERLRRGALAAVTGQQVGLFGGPLFSIFKALRQSSWRNRLRRREWSAFRFSGWRRGS